MHLHRFGSMASGGGHNKTGLVRLGPYPTFLMPRPRLGVRAGVGLNILPSVFASGHVHFGNPVYCPAS